MEDSLKKLEQACKDVSKEIRDIESKRDNVTNDIASLEARKSKLQGEVDGLQSSVESARAKVREERASQIDEIERNLRKSVEMNAGLEIDRSNLSKKQSEIDKLKDKLESQVAENSRVKEELGVKTKIVEDKLSEIESFRAKLTN